MKPGTREALGYSTRVFVASRLGLFVLAFVSVGLIEPLDPVSVPGWPAPALSGIGWHNLFVPWERFDALWFLRIADTGYRSTDGSAAFFPLFPAITRGVSFALGGRPFAAGMLAANVAFLGALWLLYLLTARERSIETARTTVLLLAVFPTSMFFTAPYSEPLFLLLAVAAFWGARGRRWWLAGVAAALAAMTRSVGIVLAPALAVEAVHQRRGSGRPILPGLAAACGPALGIALYLMYWSVRTGDALAPVHVQANWQRTFSWPWATLYHATGDMVRLAGQPNGGYWAIDWLIVVPVLAASIYAATRYRPSYAVYLWGGLLIPLCYVFAPRPLMSMPRFVLPLFPAFWALAELTGRWRIPRSAVVAVAAAGLGCLTLLFVNWYYIF